jgi:hypothetical protein
MQPKAWEVENLYKYKGKLLGKPEGDKSMSVKRADPARRGKKG